MAKLLRWQPTGSCRSSICSHTKQVMTKGARPKICSLFGQGKEKGSERARVATSVDMTLAVDRRVDCCNLQGAPILTSFGSYLKDHAWNAGNGGAWTSVAPPSLISEGFCFGTDLDPYPRIMHWLPDFLNGTIAALYLGSNIAGLVQTTAQLSQ